MRRPQGILELVEAAAVVLALQVTLDVLEQLFDTLESGVQGSHLVLCCEVLEDLGVSGLAPGSLAPQVLENSVGGLVGELEPAAEIDELRRNAGINDGVVSVTDGGLGWRLLV